VVARLERISMRTGLFLLSWLLAELFILARLFSHNYPAFTAWATGAFVVYWSYSRRGNAVSDCVLGQLGDAV
jgi:uncharacterized membrane protein YGL010W